jgi:hypothetical protein
MMLGIRAVHLKTTCEDECAKRSANVTGFEFLDSLINTTDQLADISTEKTESIISRWKKQR